MHKMMALLFSVLFISSQAYGQMDGPVRTISGTVEKVDPESGVLKVKADNKAMEFHLMPQSDLLMSNRRMSVIEVSKDDPVTIQYVSSSGDNNVISLVDNKDES